MFRSRAVATPHSTRSVPLPGGHRLTWAEYGDPDGWPVMYHHGAPGSRHEGALFDLEARIHSIRLIVPDRPGFGLSDYCPVASVGDYASLLYACLDHLGIEHCHHIGWSSGGPVALGMAAHDPERTSGVSLMASYTHFREVPGLEELLLRADQPSHFFAGKIPGSLALFVRGLFWTEHRLPWLYAALLKGILSPEDGHLLSQHRGLRQAYLQGHHEAFAQGIEGVYQDMDLQYRDWGFRLAEVHAPVSLYQGCDDPLVNNVNAEDLARRLPHASAEWIAEGGHLFPLHRSFQNRLFRDLRLCTPALRPSAEVHHLAA